MNLAKEQSVQKIFLFPVLPERLLIFKYGIWAQTVMLSKFKFNSGNIMYRVWCDFAEERQRPCHIRDDLPEITSISPLVDERCFVLKYGFWECPNIYIER